MTGMEPTMFSRGQNSSVDEAATKLFINKVANLFLSTQSQETRTSILLMMEHDASSQFYFIRALECHLNFLRKKDKFLDDQVRSDSETRADSSRKTFEKCGGNSTSKDGDSRSEWNVTSIEEVKLRFPEFDFSLPGIGSLLNGTQEADENLLRLLVSCERSSEISNSDSDRATNNSASPEIHPMTAMGHFTRLLEDTGMKKTTPEFRYYTNLFSVEESAYNLI